MKSKATLLKEKQDHIDAAKAIATSALEAGRRITPAESDAVKDHMKRAKAAHQEAIVAGGDADLLADLNAIGAPPPAAPTAYETYVDDAGNVRKRAIPKAGAWSTEMRGHLARTGQKALTTNGAISVPALSAGVTTTFDRPRSVLNLITFKPLEGTDAFSYLREVTREHLATTVAVGKRKPESNYELEKIDDKAKTVAHLTTVDRSLVSDTALLEQYLDDALREGVELELEDQVLNGDGSVAGVLDDMTGVINTTGTQAQVFATDRVVTARKAVTKLENVAGGRLNPAKFAWVMTPDDWEAYELLTDTDHYVMGPGSGQGAPLPVDRAARRLWGYPVVTSLAMTTGAPLLGDWSDQSIEIREREGVTVEFATTGYVADLFGEGAHGDLYEANKVRFRAEGRWGLAVKRPAAFILLDVLP